METMHIGDPLVAWPLKRPDKVNVEKAMKTYVVNKYGRSKKDELGAVLLRLSDMRSMVEEAPGAKAVDERYLKAHYLYCAMLTYAVQHFPFHDGTLGVAWTWADTDGRRKCQAFSPTFELAAVLFNCAALHCAVAGELDRTREDCMKAKQMYQAAAGLWEATQAKLAAEPGLNVTADMIPATLATLVKLCLCHALHMHYLIDLLNNAPHDWLAKLAYDVSQTYSSIVIQLCNPAIKDSVPRDLIHQSEMYCQLFEARAHIHLATGLHTHQKYGEEIARLERARESLRSAGRAAKHLPRKFGSFVSKVEDRLDDSISAVEKINKSYRLSTDPSQLGPLSVSGKVLVRAIPANDPYMATVPENPFKSLPRLANAPAPPAKTSPSGSPVHKTSQQPASDPKAAVLRLIEREEERLRSLEATTRELVRANQPQQPLIARVKYLQEEARAARETSCIGHILTILTLAQSAIQPSRAKLGAIEKALQARRTSDSSPMGKAVEGIRAALDKMQLTCDTIRKDVEVHFTKLEKLDMTPEQLEAFFTNQGDQLELRKLLQELEVQVRTGIAGLQELSRKARAETGPLTPATYENAVGGIGGNATIAIGSVSDRIAALQGQMQGGAKDEAKQVTRALAMFQDMMNTARALGDQASSIQEQCDLLLKDSERWAREQTVRPKSAPQAAGADDKTAVYANGAAARPALQRGGTMTLSKGQLNDELAKLEGLYRDKRIDEAQYAARLRTLHQSAAVETRADDPGETVAYGSRTQQQGPVAEKASNMVGSSLVDEITPDMCETVTKMTYDLKTKAWREEPMKVYIWDKHFDEGNLRMCFMMVAITGDGAKHRYVAKQSKDEYEPDDTYKRDIETQALASMLAEAYNARKPPKKIHFLEAFLIRLDRRPLNPHTNGPRLMHVEPYIIGDYKKYNNNWGYVSYDERNTPQAFSHFTAEYTKERYLVVDIQGVGDMYTDPQVHSHDGTRFGIGNCGQEGFEKFFETHECNALCAFLGLKPRKKKLDDYGTKAPGAGRIPRVNSAAARPQASPASPPSPTAPAPGGTTRPMRAASAADLGPDGGTTRPMRGASAADLGPDGGTTRPMRGASAADLSPNTGTVRRDSGTVRRDSTTRKDSAPPRRDSGTVSGTVRKVAAVGGTTRKMPS
eukprot:EG_transcript_1062